MSRKLRAKFNIYISDGFEKVVRDYYEYPEDEELANSDIREFLENNMILASSRDDSFDIEGGDTDGWFIQEVEEYD